MGSDRRAQPNGEREKDLRTTTADRINYRRVTLLRPCGMPAFWQRIAQALGLALFFEGQRSSLLVDIADAIVPGIPVLLRLLACVV